MKHRSTDGGWTVWLAMAEAEVGEVIRRLPPDVAGLVAEIPVVFEAVPPRELVDDGLPPDTLGLFVGMDYASGQSGSQAESPTQIHLYLENLWHYAGPSRETFREEVRVTYLHELGHFLGLDEEDLAARDID